MEAKARFGQGQELALTVQRFRGGFVFKAHRLLHHSKLGLSVIPPLSLSPNCLFLCLALSLFLTFPRSATHSLSLMKKKKKKKHLWQRVLAPPLARSRLAKPITQLLA